MRRHLEQDSPLESHVLVASVAWRLTSQKAPPLGKELVALVEALVLVLVGRVMFGLLLARVAILVVGLFGFWRRRSRFHVDDANFPG